CSVALVVSLWTTLQTQVPYFPFVVFAAITAALFGAGLYTQRRWKLHSTSRGLLVIATLLVPLDFLVMAGLAAQEQAGDPTQFLARRGIESAALVLFALFVRLGVGVLAPQGCWPLTVAVLGASASQLLAPRLLGEPLAWTLPLLAAVPVACHAGATGLVLLRLRRRSLVAEDGGRLVGFLGLATFALVVALGFLVARSGDLPAALQHLALLVALAATVPMVSGLVVQRGLEDAAAAPLRTGGTALALAGMLLMVTAVW